MTTRRLAYFVLLCLLILPGCLQQGTPPDDMQGGAEPPSIEEPVAEEPPAEEPAQESPVEEPPPEEPATPEPRPQAPTTEVPGEGDIPRFPWPPPRASTSMVIERGFFAAPGDSVRLGDVDAVLRAAFHASGYVERSYFAVPDGFAVVTRLEQIQPDGTPKAPPDRWSSETGPLRSFDLRAYIRALFTANPGYYRIIVFVVTPHPPFSQTGDPVDRDAAMGWLSTGLNRLPSALAVQRYTDDFATTALVYEFEQPGSDDATLKLPGRLTAHAHLTRSGLLNAMEGEQ